MKEISPLVVNRFQAAKLLGCEVASIDNLRKNGILKALPNVPGVRFARKDIEALAGIESEYSPFQYRMLKEENARLMETVQKYKRVLSKLRIMLEVNEIRGMME